MIMSLLSVDPLQENWDASLQALVVSLIDTLRTFKMAISLQGSHTVDSNVTIQLQDSVGNNISEKFYIRVRVANSAGYTNATNATISVLTGTLAEVNTASKDIVVQSDANGFIKLNLHDTTVETFLVLLGAPPLSSFFGNYDNSQSVVHA